MEIVEYIQAGKDHIGLTSFGRACALVRRVDSVNSLSEDKQGSQGKIDGLDNEVEKQIKSYAHYKKVKRTNML